MSTFELHWLAVHNGGDPTPAIKESAILVKLLNTLTYGEVKKV